MIECQEPRGGDWVEGEVARRKGRVEVQIVKEKVARLVLRLVVKERGATTRQRRDFRLDWAGSTR